MIVKVQVTQIHTPNVHGKVQTQPLSKHRPYNCTDLAPNVLIILLWFH